jgi:hypothetical protein
MSERSERIISTAPKAHGCTIPLAPGDVLRGDMVHQ